MIFALLIQRNISESGYAEILRNGLQFRMSLGDLEQFFGKPDVITDHADVAFAANLAKRQPDFQRAKPAGILRTKVVIVNGRIVLFTSEVVISDRMAECFQQVLGIANKRTAGLERTV